MSYSLHSPRKFPQEDFWKVKIVPPSGADAFIIRDSANTTDRLKILETGAVKAGTVTVCKFNNVDGCLEIRVGKLTGNLNANSYNILNVTKITSPAGTHLTLDSATGYICAELSEGGQTKPTI